MLCYGNRQHSHRSKGLWLEDTSPEIIFWSNVKFQRYVLSTKSCLCLTKNGVSRNWHEPGSGQSDYSKLKGQSRQQCTVQPSTDSGDSVGKIIIRISKVVCVAT